MPKINESKYITALQKLNSSVKKSDGLSLIIDSCALDKVEEIMDKMEWNISVAINSCVTYTISISKKLNLSRYENFQLPEENDTISLDLTIKNENRMTLMAEENNQDYNERFVSYIISESINIFYNFLLGASNVYNEQE